MMFCEIIASLERKIISLNLPVVTSLEGETMNKTKSWLCFIALWALFVIPLWVFVLIYVIKKYQYYYDPSDYPE